ncbi:hypothetical protein HDV06_002560 [Boothiomyces sp. JEL0866]|nr:hypothetical protein HDV06_002560 [Boothiomyces sp. JEL0866]
MYSYTDTDDDSYKYSSSDIHTHSLKSILKSNENQKIMDIMKTSDAKSHELNLKIKSLEQYILELQKKNIELENVKNLNKSDDETKESLRGLSNLNTDLLQQNSLLRRENLLFKDKLKTLGYQTLVHQINNTETLDLDSISPSVLFQKIQYENQQVQTEDFTEIENNCNAELQLNEYMNKYQMEKDINQTLYSEIEQLKNEIKVLETNYTKLSNDAEIVFSSNQLITNNYQTLQNKNEDLLSKNQELVSIAKKLKTSLYLLQKEKETLEKTNHQIELINIKSQSTLETIPILEKIIDQDKDKFKNQINLLRQTVEILERENKELKNEKIDANEYYLLMANNSNNTDLIDKLEKELQNQIETMIENKQIINKQQNIIKCKTVENKKLLKSIEDLRANLKHKESIINGQKIRLENCQERIDELDHKFKSNQSLINTKTEIIKSLKSMKSKEPVTIVKQIKETDTKTRKRLFECQSEIKNLKSILETNKQTIADLRSQYKSKISQIENKQKLFAYREHQYRNVLNNLVTNKEYQNISTKTSSLYYTPNAPLLFNLTQIKSTTRDNKTVIQMYKNNSVHAGEYQFDGKLLYTIYNEYQVGFVYQLIVEQDVYYGIDYIQGNQRLPGIMTYNNHLLYSRKDDSRLFRILLSDQTPGNNFLDNLGSNRIGGKQWNTEIAGPLQKNHPGRILCYTYLKSKPHTHSILVVQYLPYEKSVFFKIMVSIYTFSDGSWYKDVLWQTELAGLGEDLIDSDSVDYLYFLTNPILGTLSNGEMVVFVFIEQMFTLSFQNKNNLHGYVLKTQPVMGMYGSDFDIDLISIIKTDAIYISLVSENQKIFIFTDKLIKQNVFSKLSKYIWFYIESPGIFVEMVGVYLLSIIDKYLQEETIDISQIDFPIEKTIFNLVGMWQGDQHITFLTKLEDSVAALLQDGTTVVLDPTVIDTTPSGILFITKRWALLLSLCSIVLLFTLNEIK